MEANIPFIAIDIPHPGAIYFGANNYQAGLIAGRFLGRWAKRHWDGDVDEILLIELQRAGSLPQARIRGMVSGIGEVIRIPDTCRMVSVDGDGQFQTSLERVRKHLRQSQSRRVLVGAANDSSALGALRAYEEAGRANDCVVVGQNGEPEARAELRAGRSRLIASVGYFPEKYGDGLMRLAFEILARKAVAPAVFTNHQIITPDNVDHYYPNDSLMVGSTAYDHHACFHVRHHDVSPKSSASQQRSSACLSPAITASRRTAAGNFKTPANRSNTAPRSLTGTLDSRCHKVSPSRERAAISTSWRPSGVGAFSQRCKPSRNSAGASWNHGIPGPRRA